VGMSPVNQPDRRAFAGPGEPPRDTTYEYVDLVECATVVDYAQAL
jgi:hypothetical protein